MNRLLITLSLFIVFLSCDKEKPQAPLRSNPLDENNPTQTAEFVFEVELNRVSNGLRLQWDPLDHPSLRGYRIYRTIGRGTRVSVLDVAPSVKTWTDTSAVDGRSYRYEVALLMGNQGEWVSERSPLARWAGPPLLSIEGETSGIYVPSKDVQLRVQADGARRLQWSRSADFAGSEWGNYAELTPWQLESGPHAMYARVIYDTGDTSEVSHIDLVVDQRPVAAAGGDAHQLVGALLSLDGGSSTDPEGGALTYRWQVPSGVTITDSTASKVDIRTDRAGQYTIELIVSDGRWEQVDKVQVNFTHQPEAAIALSNRVYGVGESVVLDGGGSTDADGDALTYSWTVPEGVTLTDGDSATPTFVAEAPGTYVVELVVSDGTWDSEVSRVEVELAYRPIAVVGDDVVAAVGDVVVLDGSSSSHGDGDALTYSWRVPAEIELDDPTSAAPSFTGQVAGSFTIGLVVSDGVWESREAQMTVEVSHRPVSSLLLAERVYGVGESVVLDGSGSTDADGDALTYSWTVPEGVTLTDGDSATPTFVAEEPGVYTVELVVSDGVWTSEISRVELEIVYRPVAVLGDDIIAAVGDVVVLDGSGSSGGNGDGLKYSWRVPDEIELDDAETATPSFTASEAGSYTVSLVVSDGELESNEVVLTIEVSYRPEAVIALSENVVGVGESVSLDGTGSSDGDGDGGSSRSLTYIWSVSGRATLKDATTSTPTFVAEEPGTYTVELVVSDGVWVSQVSRVELVVTESTGSAQIQGTVTESTGNAQVEGTIQD